MAGILLLWSCDDRREQLSAIEDQQQVPTLEIDSLRIDYTESGLLRMNLQAPLLHRFLLAEQPYNVFPEGMHIYFYTAGRELENEIVADYAYNREKPEEYWQATGNVVVKNHLKKQTLYTDTLYWNRANRTIYTHAPVRIETPGFFFDGLGGMTADERFEEYKFFNAGNGALYMDDEPGGQDGQDGGTATGDRLPEPETLPDTAARPSQIKREKEQAVIKKTPLKTFSAAENREAIQAEEIRP
jgi:LPS export ABC transporter protein LptC